MLNIPFGDQRRPPRGRQPRPPSIRPGRTSARSITCPARRTRTTTRGKAQLRIKPTSRWTSSSARDYTLQRGLGFGGANVIGLLNYRADVNNTPNDLSDDVAPLRSMSTISTIRATSICAAAIPRRSRSTGARGSTSTTTPARCSSSSSRAIASSTGISTRAPTRAFFVDENAAAIAMQQYDNWSFAAQQNNDSKSAVTELRIAPRTISAWCGASAGSGSGKTRARSSARSRATRGGFNEFNMPSTVG